MPELLFEAPPVVTLPVIGEAAEYPVHRVFCVGRNYAAHAAEMGNVVDREEPFYFTKSTQHLIPSGQVIPYPLGTQNYHHEMELAFAIGAPTFRATEVEALNAVYGYASALDMTRRDLQSSFKEKRRPWDLSKDFEQSVVVTRLTKTNDFGSVADQRIWLNVNGELRQDAKLSDMIHSVPRIIVHLSQFYHLRPGDLILTGTPAGVGAVKAGDVLEGGIDGLEQIALTLADPE